MIFVSSKEKGNSGEIGHGQRASLQLEKKMSKKELKF